MKNKVLIIALSILALYACDNNKIDKTVYLQIGNFQITKYEYERNKNREIDTNTLNANQTKYKEALEKWNNDFVNRCFIIADAYAKKYDTISNIQNYISQTGNYMMVQKYGYLWKHNFAPTLHKYKELDETKLSKRKKLYYFNYITCSNINSLLKITDNDSVINNKTEFLKLKKSIAVDTAFKQGYYSDQWPFLACWDYKDDIYNMKKGDVSSLLTVNGYLMYLYLDKVENIEIDNNEKTKLQTELEIGIVNELEKKEKNEIEKKCKPVINAKNVDIFYAFLKSGKTIDDFNNNLELIHYQLNNTNKSLGAKDFANYYSNLPMKTDISDKGSLVNCIYQFFNYDYRITEANKNDLYNTDEFNLDKKNFLNNVLYSHYLEKEIYGKIKVDSLEVEEYYEKNKSQYVQPQTISISVYYFNSVIDAQKNISLISTLLKQNDFNRTKDTSIIKGLKKCLPHVNVNIQSNNDYPRDLIKNLLVSENNVLLPQPLMLKNEPVLIFKEDEKGKYIETLENVYNDIESQVKFEKSKIAIEKLIAKLKSQYNIEINKI